MSFRPALLTRILAVAFFGVMVVVAAVTASGLAAATGNAFVLLTAVAVIPALMVIVAALRMWVLLARVITVGPERLEHRQPFKTADLRWEDLTAIEMTRRADDEASALRVRWQGGDLYILSSAVEDWMGLVDAIRAQLARRGRDLTVVESFGQ